MNVSPLISVVVPACGCERFLPRLFSSLEKQTFRDFEVLLAVEESDDRSLQMCKDWATGAQWRTPLPCRVFSLPCTGAGGASRNHCYREARGEYLVPVDGDDWIETDALELIAARIKQHHPDVLLGSARIWVDKGDGACQPTGDVLSNLSQSEDGAVMDGFELIRRISARGMHCRNHGALVIVRREFLLERHLFQLEAVPSEDSYWTPKVILAAKKLVFIGRPYYNYRRREGSVSSIHDARILRATAAIALKMSRYLQQTELPADIRRHLGNDVVSIFNWYLFHQTYSSRFTRRDRLSAIRSMFSTTSAKQAYRWLFGCTSRAKRMGYPLIRLAAIFGFLLPSTLYYRYLYYPLSKYKK